MSTSPDPNRNIRAVGSVALGIWIAVLMIPIVIALVCCCGPALIGGRPQ